LKLATEATEITEKMVKGFGNRFNEWLKKKGKTPLTEEEIVLFNESGQRVGKQLIDNKDVICKRACDFAASLCALSAANKRRKKK